MTIKNEEIVPCRNCQKRNAGCHAVCEEYKDWRKNKDEKHKEYLERNRSDLEYEYYIKAKKRSHERKKILSEKEKRKIYRNI